MTKSGAGHLQQYLDDPAVREVLVNGHEVWVERNGVVEGAEGFASEEEALRLAEALAVKAGIEFSAENPLEITVMPGDIKLYLVHPSVSGVGVAMNFSKRGSRGHPDAPA